MLTTLLDDELRSWLDEPCYSRSEIEQQERQARRDSQKLEDLSILEFLSEQPMEKDQPLYKLELAWFEAEKIDSQTLLAGYSISCPRKGYRKNFQTMNLELFKAILKPKTARLEGLSRTDERLCFADFDYLPEHFKSWVELREFLRDMIGSDGIVTESTSGKAKILFRMAGNPEKIIIQEFLRDKLWQFWDQKIQIETKSDKPVFRYLIDRDGIDHTFITEERLQIYQHNLAHISIHNLNIFSLSSTIVYPTAIVHIANPLEKWNMFEGSLPVIIQSMNQNKQFVFRFLSSSFYLSTSDKGMALPQNLLADLLEVSQKTISMIIKEFKDRGIIVKTANHYQGILAAKYKFNEAFMEWALKEFDKIKSEKKCSEVSENTLSEKKDQVKSEAIAGNIYHSAWKAANLFTDESSLVLWASEILAVKDKPARLKVFIRAFRKHLELDSRKKNLERKVA